MAGQLPQSMQGSHARPTGRAEPAAPARPPRACRARGACQGNRPRRPTGRSAARRACRARGSARVHTGPGHPDRASPGQNMPGQSIPGQQSLPGQHAAPPAPQADSSRGCPTRGCAAPTRSLRPRAEPVPGAAVLVPRPGPGVPSRPYQQGTYGGLPSEQLMPGQPYSPPAPSPAGQGRTRGRPMSRRRGLTARTPRCRKPPRRTARPVPPTPVPQSHVPQTPMQARDRGRRASPARPGAAARRRGPGRPRRGLRIRPVGGPRGPSTVAGGRTGPQAADAVGPGGQAAPGLGAADRFAAARRDQARPAPRLLGCPGAFAQIASFPCTLSSFVALEGVPGWVRPRTWWC